MLRHRIVRRREGIELVLLGGLTGLTLIFHAACGYAQGDEKRQPTPIVPEGQTIEGQTIEGGETLKERLSDKASDEQRVDNCKVPLDRRGSKIRAEGCGHEDASATPSQLPHD
jgi:hypothetical protein